MLDNFLDSEEKKPSDIENFNTEMCKELIPMIGMRIPEWRGFPKKHFHVQTYKAHKHLYDSLKNRHSSLVNAEQKRIKEEQEFQEL